MNNVPVNLASIDIGTNSTLLLVAEYDGTNIKPLENRAEITRLGQSVNKTKKLAAEAVERTFSVLSRYKTICDRYNVSHVSIGGTSALRDATNGQEFITKVKNQLGWTIQILTGDLEAELTFLSTRNEFHGLDTEYLVADIGGGSTEFISGDAENIHFMKSLNIGTVRFTERFIQQDPPGDREISQLENTVRTEMKTGLRDLHLEDSTSFIGVAGTVTTLQAVEKELAEYDPDEIHRSQLSIDQIDGLLKKFRSVKLNQRKQFPGLQPQRADVIIAGNIIVREIMRHFGFDHMYVSDRGVRYGLMYDYIRKSFNNLTRTK